MKVVLDASPVSYLLLIGEIEILPALYDQLLLPSAVATDLGDPEAPLVIREWMASPPSWLEIHPGVPRPPEELSRLHTGEREVIFLAEDLGADLVILDDLEARGVAIERGLKIMGLLGVLDRAAESQLIDLPSTVERLQATNFRVAPWLLKDLLDRRIR